MSKTTKTTVLFLLALSIGPASHALDGLILNEYGFVFQDAQVLGKTVDGDNVLLSLWPASLPAPAEPEALFHVWCSNDPAEPDLNFRLLGKVCAVLEVGDLGFEWSGLPLDSEGPYSTRFQLTGLIAGIPTTPEVVFYDGFESGDTSAWSTEP